jgi:UDP-N-acetylglucosamine acyltransferase
MIDLDIKSIIPHRYPFLLVDRILEYEDKKRIVSIKNVTINEPFFPGHFPEQPIMPGVLQLEAMAQTAAVLFLKDPEFADRLPYFAAVDNARFRKPVVPGDQLRMEMVTTKHKGAFIKMDGKALVDGKVVSQGSFVFTLTQKPSKPQIHPTAHIHSSAVLGKDVIVGPHTIVGENVIVGDRTVLEAHVKVEKWTKIGEDCHIHFGCVIGSAAQDLKYNGEEAWVIIGNRNQLREYVTINRATGKNATTKIGNDNILMTNTHLGHNCQLGNNITIANMSSIAGHTTIEDFAVIGGVTGIHQFVRIGKGAMVGGYSRLPQDVPPFTICEGNPATMKGINLIGLKRRGASANAIKEIKELFKLYFRSGKNTSQALKEISETQPKEPETIHMLNFLKEDSKRGITKKIEKTTTEIDSVETPE